MTVDNEIRTKNKPATPRELLKMTTIAYSVMAVVGFEICWWYHKNIGALLGPLTYDYRVAAGMVVAAVLFLHFCQRAMEEFFPSYRAFKKNLAVLFSGLGVWGALWLALVSSAGEEILFRGAIQPFLGIWFTSFLFGALHLDPEGGVSVWTGWAVLAGVVLGGVVNVTGSLWPAVAIHFTVNFIGLLALARPKIKPRSAQ
jgi:membrane protease YdiL (CAAX protease family)